MTDGWGLVCYSVTSAVVRVLVSIEVAEEAVDDWVDAYSC